MSLKQMEDQLAALRLEVETLRVATDKAQSTADTAVTGHLQMVDTPGSIRLSRHDLYGCPYEY